MLCKEFYSAYIEVQTRAINVTLTLSYVTILSTNYIFVHLLDNKVF